MFSTRNWCISTISTKVFVFFESLYPKKSVRLCWNRFGYISIFRPKFCRQSRPTFFKSLFIWPHINMLRFSRPKVSMFQLCLTYNSTVLDLCFDWASLLFPLCSTYIGSVLDLFRMFSTYNSTVLELGFDCAWPMFGLCSTQFLTVLELFFDCTRPIF